MTMASSFYGSFFQMLKNALGFALRRLLETDVRAGRHQPADFAGRSERVAARPAADAAGALRRRRRRRPSAAADADRRRPPRPRLGLDARNVR